MLKIIERAKKALSGTNNCCQKTVGIKADKGSLQKTSREPELSASHMKSIISDQITFIYFLVCSKQKKYKLLKHSFLECQLQANKISRVIF